MTLKNDKTSDAAAPPVDHGQLRRRAEKAVKSRQPDEPFSMTELARTVRNALDNNGTFL
jgi:hypothetical protein